MEALNEYQFILKDIRTWVLYYNHVNSLNIGPMFYLLPPSHVLLKKAHLIKETSKFLSFMTLTTLTELNMLQ